MRLRLGPEYVPVLPCLAQFISTCGSRPGTDHCLGSRWTLTGVAGGNMLSYTARASRIKRARSRSDFEINRTTSLNGRSKLGTMCVQHSMRTSCHPGLEAIRGLLIYCSDYKCSHGIGISGDR